MGLRPSEKNWHYVGSYSESYGKAWDEGYEAAKSGLTLSDNPYRESGHERDTTYQDELHYWWYSGWCGYKEEG